MKSIAQYALQTLRLMDLTSLNDDDTEEKIIELCKNVQLASVKVAAVCVYPQFIQIAKKQLAKQNCADVKVATVTNFPHGNADISFAVTQTHEAIALGADEVDVVFPYLALIKGDSEVGFELVKQCKTACGDKTLKVILETGELKTRELITLAAKTAISAGADFIKTSTGKVPVNATLESAKIMLNVIKSMNKADSVGFKAAGGVKTAKEAAKYLDLTAQIMTDDWIDATHFRFGTSGLLNDLLLTLNEKPTTQRNTAQDPY